MEIWKLKGSVTHRDASTLQEEKEFCIIDSWSEFLTEVNVTEESSYTSKAGAKNLCKWKLAKSLQQQKSDHVVEVLPPPYYQPM